MTQTRALVRPRELGGIADTAELRRAVTLDGLVVLASYEPSRQPADVEELCNEEGWAMVRASSPDAASWAASARKTSLVVVMGTDLAFVVKTVVAVRAASTSPLAVLATLTSAERTRVLAAGADVVVAHDLPRDELRAQLFALLRRAAATWEPTVRYLASEPLVVDLWARECRIGSETMHLSPTEFDLLVYLMRHPRQAVPIEKIIRHVWRSRSYQRQLNAARIAICRTRARLGEHGCEQLIHSVRRVGYEFIGSVTELGDSAHERSTPDLGSLRLSGTLLELAGILRSLPFFDAAQVCLDKVMETTSGNAGAIYCNVDDQIVLLAERGNPAEFCDFMRGGISFEGRAKVHTLDERQPTQIEDLALLTKSSQTVNIMARNGFRSYLYIPLVADDQAWGGMHLANKTRRPFDPVVTTFCSAVGAMLSLTLPRSGDALAVG